MTQREIEMLCREELNESIPDAEALWQRIESQLPQQELQTTSQIEMKRTSPIKRHTLSTVATIAACFVILVGLGKFATGSINKIFNSISNKTSNLISQPSSVTSKFEQPADHNFKNEEVFENDAHKYGQSYGSLNFNLMPWNDDEIDFGSLIKGDTSFNEVSVLRKAECILITEWVDATQDAKTGEMVYELYVENGYGTDVPTQETIRLRSNSAYILQAGHTFILPLYKEGTEWKLAAENVPQIEMTLDGDIVFHDGWISLLSRDTEILTGFPYSEYLHRMYIGDEVTLQRLLAAWEDAKNT